MNPVRAPHLVVRADAVEGFGAGHVARQLALIEAWTDRGGSTTVASDHLPEFWRTRFLAEGTAVVSPDAWLRGAPTRVTGSGDWAAVDGYGHGADERSAWRARLGRLLVVDDHALSPISPADVVVDQNLGASSLDYADTRYGSPTTLLGPRYALLRREFRSIAATNEGGDPSAAGEVKRVALGWGGAPTPAVRERFREVGAALQADGFEVVALDGVDVDAVLDTVDLVVSAAGTITWEICAKGLPAVLVPVADNQIPVATRMVEAGAAVMVGGAELDPSVDAIVTAVRSLADPSATAQRRGLARVARSMVDGLGAVRVVTVMRAVGIELRPVTEQDAHVLWEWANDEDVRRNAFSTAAIGWDEHVAWLTARLADDRASLYIASDDEGPVGHVRFADPPEGDIGVEVSVALAPARRGEHLGAPLIEAGVRRAFVDPAVTSVLARVKPENVGSQRAFIAADFDPDGAGTGDGHEWLRYTRTRHGVASRSPADG